ncbi:hypothetical protein GQ53DRAFT_95772 [Thozetella sp. PMI_491]|nr:hypothetical protein GQ53DRAFT_95772 [Thozetella sp. PMI_491]
MRPREAHYAIQYPPMPATYCLVITNRGPPLLVSKPQLLGSTIGYQPYSDTRPDGLISTSRRLGSFLPRQRREYVPKLFFVSFLAGPRGETRWTLGSSHLASLPGTRYRMGKHGAGTPWVTRPTMHGGPSPGTVWVGSRLAGEPVIGCRCCVYRHGIPHSASHPPLCHYQSRPSPSLLHDLIPRPCVVQRGHLSSADSLRARL